MKTGEAVEAYRPRDGDEGIVVLRNMGNPSDKEIIPVKVLAVDGDKISVRGKGKAYKRRWIFENFHEEIKDGEYRVNYANSAGLLRVEVKMAIEQFADISEITIGERKED